MLTLPNLLTSLWGRERAREVAEAYRDALTAHPQVLRDLALFCNAAAPIQGATEFDRGVEEGKRRVFLHLARMAGLKPADFVPLSDGDFDP